MEEHSLDCFLVSKKIAKNAIAMCGGKWRMREFLYKMKLGLPIYLIAYYVRFNPGCEISY